MSAGTFYQKYRSRNFQEIIGQEHVVLTLKNAIENNRLSHAYIFSGPRGTGKTSLARILAKSLNCRPNGASITPCLDCDLCRGITSGIAADVIEIDAASHTGVDNIRDLNDKMGFMPLECRYKIYIIDEAHMLSTGAFNALLKTLEEPPANTIFILATTEPHKIPVTIHSRCQQLHFRNLTLTEIQNHVKWVCEQESISIDEGALQIIARNAGGCMRDALSLLNHVFSFKGQTISAADVLFVLGSTDDSRMVALLQSVAKTHTQAVIQQLDALYADGANPSQLLIDLLRVLRAALAIAAGIKQSGYADESSTQALQELVKVMTLSRLAKLIEVLAKTESDLRWFSSAELLLQLRLVTWEESTQEKPVAAPTQAPVQASTQAPAQASTQKVAPIQTPPVQAQQPVAASPAQTIVTKEPVPEVRPVEPTIPGEFNARTWDSVINEAKLQKNALYSIVKDSYFVSQTETAVTIGLKQDFQFFRDKINEEKSKFWLNETVSKLSGKKLVVQLKDSGTVSVASDQNAGVSGVNHPTHSESKREERISQIVSMFEGTVL